MRASKLFGMLTPAILLVLSGAACNTIPQRRLSGVPQTGQMECWDEAGNSIGCAGTGQDGELQKGASVAPRFTDNGDGTVTDNLTNLTWLKDASCFELMKWTDALSVANRLSTGCCCGLSDGSRAGDWRLPNIKELHSLVDYGQFSPSFPPVHPFVGVKAGFYWSSTSIKGNPNRAFSLYLNFGVEATSLKTEKHLAWPVRDGP